MKGFHLGKLSSKDEARINTFFTIKEWGVYVDAEGNPRLDESGKKSEGYVSRQISDRRNVEEVYKLIENQIVHYLKLSPDNNEEMFFQSHKDLVNEWHGILCPEWMKSGKTEQKRMHFDLMTYLYTLEMVKGKLEIQHDELKSCSDKIRLLIELGIVDHLKERYQILNISENQLAKVLEQLTSHKQQTIQPLLAAFRNPLNKNYPSLSKSSEMLLKYLNESNI